jgi:glutamate 5-kinase
VQQAAALAIRNQQVVAAVQIDEFVLGPVEAIYSSPRVVVQTPKAGTLLARGATVNLVFANGRSLLADAIVGVSGQFKGRQLGTVYDQFIKDDPTLTALVGKYGEDKTLSEAERAVVEQSLARKGVEVGNDFDGAMVALGAAYTFNGIAT